MVNSLEVPSVPKTMGPFAKQKRPSDHSAHKVPVDLSNARIGQQRSPAEDSLTSSYQCPLLYVCYALLRTVTLAHVWHQK